MRLPHPGSSRLALMSAAAGVACLAFATPAWATAGTQQSNAPVRASHGDPKGANGTVKIDDDVPVDDSIRNEPHVDCDFAVKFFNFDNGQHANIIFTVHPPTGSETVLLRRDNVLVSTDAASGGKPDPDEVFTFSASQLGLAAYTPQPKQGYHVKLTVEIIGAPGAGKHKVFWIRPCAENQSSSVGGGKSGDHPGQAGGGTNSGAGTPAGGTNSGGGSPSGNGSPSASGSPSAVPSASAPQALIPAASGPRGGLPTTGAAIASTAALGLGLIAAGGALLFLRRRRSFGVEA